MDESRMQELDDKILKLYNRMKEYLIGLGFVFEVSDQPIEQLSREEVERYEKQHFNAIKLDADLRSLVVQILKERLILERIENPSPEHFQKARINVVRYLWINGSWTEPWITLVDRELPGKEPSKEDLESFVEAAPEIAIAQMEATVAFDKTYDAIMEILQEGGYPIDPNPSLRGDYAVAISLSLLKLRGGTDDPWSTIREHATNPNHPAWRVVIETFFTD